MSLVDYSSSSDSEHESDDSWTKQQIKNPKRKSEDTDNRIRLPNANDILSKIPNEKAVEETFSINDNPDYHEGRQRSFKHERGNWATYVYIPIASSVMDELQNCALKHLSQFQQFHRVTNLHLSLSRTFVLPYHFIQSFAESIEEAIKLVPKFTMSLEKLNTYANDEKSRTFLALSVGNPYEEIMLNLLQKVDKVMMDFKLPAFYEDPSFHISFLWCLDDKTACVKPLMPHLYNAFGNQLPIHVPVKEVCCKSGHKIFTYKLS